MFKLRKTRTTVSPFVLVIDHDPDFVATVRHRLECAQFHVDTATDGSEGLEKAVTDKPNLILLDLRMPAAHGRDVLESLRKDNHQTEVPVIVWSTSADIEDITWAASFGVRDYVTKPFYLYDLLVRIARTVQPRGK